MKETTIYARVVAKAVSFPDDIEMHYIRLDDNGGITSDVYGGVCFTWEEIKHRFWVDKEYAQFCEEHFRNGDAVFLGNQNVTIEMGNPTQELSE